MLDRWTSATLFTRDEHRLLADHLDMAVADGEEVHVRGLPSEEFPPAVVGAATLWYYRDVRNGAS